MRFQIPGKKQLPKGVDYKQPKAKKEVGAAKEKIF